MAAYIALLRAINVSGRNKISMADLRALFADLGAEDVVTYVQSGNVVFSSTKAAGTLPGAIEAAISREHGLDVKVLLRTGTQLDSILTRNPFTGGGRDTAKLHVTFLSGSAAAARTRALRDKSFEPDELRIAGREIYLHCPAGYGRSKLTNAYLEQQLGLAATTRNWKTVNRLAELAAR